MNVDVCFMSGCFKVFYQLTDSHSTSYKYKRAECPLIFIYLFISFQVGQKGSWMQYLPSGLTKVLLNALRNITDDELLAFVNRAPNLVRMDLLGIRDLTPMVCVE